MIPTLKPQQHEHEHFQPRTTDIVVETIKRHPHSCAGSDQEDRSGTLTRDAPTEACYMNVTIEKDKSRESEIDEPVETYVEMNQLRPHPLVKLEQEYANQPERPSSPFEDNYHTQALTKFDPVTTQKLIDNVQHLMITVKEQAKEILTLKMTVKDLKLKVEALENFDRDPYEYDQ